MCEMKVKDGVTIDAVENVVAALQRVGKCIKDPEIIRKFVITEKNTLFYIDDKLKSTMTPCNECKYMWIDTGFRDTYGNPIFVSLKKHGTEYVGHITGTVYELADRLSTEFYKNKIEIRCNITIFKKKYMKKTSIRKVPYISNEREYYLQVVNNEDISGDSAFAKALAKAGIVLGDLCEEEEKEEKVLEETLVASEDVPSKIKEEDFSNDELTIGLLLEQMDKMQARMDELVDIIEENKKDKALIEELRKENDGYRKSLRDIHMYNDAEEMKRQKRAQEKEESVQGLNAHALLGNHKKILVIGAAAIGVDVMQAIAKNEFGFEKKDLVFENDYKKVVNGAGRLQNSSKYCAVIFGKMPHKVSKLGCWSSLIEKFSQDEIGPYSIEAQNNAGELIINKESFRLALVDIYKHLKEKDVA